MGKKTPIHIASDQEDGAFGIANHGPMNLVGATNARGSANNGVTHAVGTTLEYTPPADSVSGAYSLYSTRLAISTYTGPLIRLRRDSDQAEADIFPKANGQIDDDFISSFAGGANTFIETWYDQGENFDLSNSTAGSQPAWDNTGLFGKGNGTSSCLLNNSGADAPWNTTHFVSMVISLEESQNQGQSFPKIFGNGSFSGGGMIIDCWGTAINNANQNCKYNTADLAGFTGNVEIPSPTPNTDEVLGFIKETTGANDWEAYQDASNVDTDTYPGYTNTTGFWSMFCSWYNGDFVVGNIKEILLFQNSNTADLVSVQNNQKSYFGV